MDLIVKENFNYYREKDSNPVKSLLLQILLHISISYI